MQTCCCQAAVLVLPDVIHLLHLQHFHYENHNKQKPVDVHEQQHKEKSIEEEVERDVGHKLEAGNTCGKQHFEREPVQTEQEPSDAEADRDHIRQDVVEPVIASTSGLQVDVELDELQLDVTDVVEEQHQDPYVVVPESI